MRGALRPARARGADRRSARAGARAARAALGDLPAWNGCHASIFLATALVLLVAAAAAVLARDDSPPAGVAGDPDAAGRGRRGRQAARRPVRVGPAARSDFAQRAAAGNSHLLYALSPGGARRERRAHGALAAARRARGASRPASTPTRSRGSCSSRAPGARTRGRPAALESASGSRRSSPRPASNLLGMHVDVAASTRLTRQLAKAERRGRTGARRALRRARARVDDRFDPGEGAGRHRALPDDRQEALRPRGPRVRLLPHGHRQPARACWPRTAAARSDLRRAVLRLDADRATARAYAKLARLRRRLVELPVEDRRRRGDHAAVPRRPRPSSTRLAALQTAKASAEEVLHPADRTPAFATPSDLRDGWDDGRHRAVPDRRGGHRAAARRPHGRARAATAPAGGSCTAGCAARRWRWRCTSAPRCGRSAAVRRPLIVTSTVRDGDYQALLVQPQRRGDAQLLAAHHRLGVRRRAPLPLAPARRWRSSSCSTGCAR